MGLTIGLTYDLRTDYLAEGYGEEAVAEFDREDTIAALEGAIRSLGYAAERIGHGRALCRRLAAGGRWGMVFNIAEGLRGRSREAQVPCLLELYGIAYTFSDPLVCAATLDKSVAKRLVQAAGLPTPRYAVVRDPGDAARVSLDYPLFLKPLAEGTSKGIDGLSLVTTPEQLAAGCRKLLERFAQPVLVEDYLPGREFTAGILGTGPAARVLGMIEVHVKHGGGERIYSYEAKERSEELVDYCLAPCDPAAGKAEELALQAYRALECRDAARVDVRLDRAGEPSFMEVNPLPGLHPDHSDLPIIAKQVGMTYKELIQSILDSALTRAGISR